jgi:hypothetical protein
VSRRASSLAWAAVWCPRTPGMDVCCAAASALSRCHPPTRGGGAVPLQSAEKARVSLGADAGPRPHDARLAMGLRKRRVVDGSVRTRDLDRRGSCRPLEHPEDIVTPAAIGSPSPDGTGWRMGVASQPVLDIVDRVDLGFETLPLGAHVVPGSVITATPAVAQHRTGGSFRALPTPDVCQRTERPRARPRKLCAQGTEGATSGAVPPSPPPTHPCKESGGFALRYARQ